MVRLFPRVCFAALGLSLMFAMPAAAQSVRLLGDFRDWSAYATADEAGRVCFVITKPTTTDPVPEGLDEAHLYLTHRPAENIRNELNLVAGYAFGPDTEATLNIGGQTFALFTDADAAWLSDPAQADAVASALRAGSSATIEGTSERGLRITQSFSLSGVTAASRAIDAEC